MQSKWFWIVAIAVTGAIEEALRNDFIPAQYVPAVSSASTFLGFLIQKVRAA